MGYMGLWLVIVEDVSVWNIRGLASNDNQVKSNIKRTVQYNWIMKFYRCSFDHLPAHHH